MKMYEITVRLSNGDFVSFENVQVVHGIQCLGVIGVGEDGDTFEHYYPYNNILFVNVFPMTEPEVKH